ncbi:SNAPIN protein homolog [Thrips palmi]|uniref:Biogenesis of lysosome-related organelles complex 1 subunit 7 n=1 Tax=Thrips palmi TaxID=161013 RepID=A0A6P9A1A5_THRPL|nr:SNAPIN protein homolog [Thrips palmi]XP_034251553.1 SNAPIN protein homolog [Thrips palmi]
MEQRDDASTNTSIDDKTEDFGDNPTRDTLADGLLGLLRPTVEQLDDRVKATRISQGELKQHLDSLSDEIKQLSEHQACPLDLEKYIRKLNDAKAKITVVGNILQSSQDRLIKLTQHINKEQNRRKALIEPTSNITPSSTPLEPTSTSN